MINNYSKNNHCKCGKAICNDSDHCKKCSQTGELNHQFTSGITVTKHYCSKCKTGITGRGKTGLCTECQYEAITGKHTSEWRGEYPKCECGKVLSSYEATRCKICSNKARIGQPRLVDMSGDKNPMFGVHRFGAKNPNWIDGRSFLPYPPDFNDELKEQIRKRDNYICQNCGMTEEEHIIVFGQVLHIHHIDYNKENCAKENLVTVCGSCNTRANANRSYWIEFYQQKVKIS